jgi:Holliday junction resolvase RusA-like endonuclease
MSENGVRRLEIFVAGDPKPMGSKTAFVVRGPRGSRAVVTDGKSGKAMRSWQDSVTAEALSMWGDGGRMTGPVEVVMTFFLARPGGQLNKHGQPRPSAPRYPAVKPDIDKLARSTLDALAVVLLADDSRVVTLTLGKRYADEGPTGARISVVEVA